MNPETRTNLIILALTLLIAVAAMIAFGGPVDANRSPAVRATCVPAKTGNEPQALCTIPNVREKPRFFAMRCVRLPR